MSGASKFFKRRRRLETETVLRKGEKIVGFVAYCKACKGPTTHRKLTKTKRQCLRCERQERDGDRKAVADIVNERAGISHTLHSVAQTSERQGTVVLSKTDLGVAGADRVGDTLRVVGTLDKEAGETSAATSDTNA